MLRSYADFTLENGTLAVILDEPWYEEPGAEVETGRTASICVCQLCILHFVCLGANAHGRRHFGLSLPLSLYLSLCCLALRVQGLIQQRDLGQQVRRVVSPCPCDVIVINVADALIPVLQVLRRRHAQLQLHRRC